jgi:hypothetical protein
MEFLTKRLATERESKHQNPQFIYALILLPSP